MANKEDELFELPSNHLFVTPSREETAHLIKLGFHSIPNPFGYNGWDLSFGKKLEGRTVTILQGVSNDGYAANLYNNLLETSIDILTPYQRIILPGSISEFNKNEFLAHVKRSIQAEKGKQTTFRFEDAIISAEDFISQNIPPKKTILKPWLTEQSFILIAGWRGTGKTWLGVSMVDAKTRGESFGPWTTETPVPACYVDGELPAADVQERFRVVASLSKAERKVRLYVYSDCYANSLGPPRANLSNQEWRETFKAFLIKEGFKILALDSLSSLAPGIDENLKRDWDPINQWLLDLRFAGISSILFHHTGKGKDQRGTSAHEDNADTSIILSHPSDYVQEQGVRFILKFKKKRGRNVDLHMIRDYEFSLSGVEGHTKWIWKSAKGRTRIEILKLINAGMTQSEIAKTLGVDKGYVSRIKVKAIEKGLLTEDGKLTEKGLQLVNPGESDEEL